MPKGDEVVATRLEWTGNFSVLHFGIHVVGMVI